MVLLDRGQRGYLRVVDNDALSGRGGLAFSRLFGNVFGNKALIIKVSAYNGMYIRIVTQGLEDIAIGFLIVDLQNSGF